MAHDVNRRTNLDWPILYGSIYKYHNLRNYELSGNMFWYKLRTEIKSDQIKEDESVRELRERSKSFGREPWMKDNFEILGVHRKILN